MTHGLPPVQTPTTVARSASADADLVSMVALVGHLAAATAESASFAAILQDRMPASIVTGQLVASTAESTRLAIEVQDRLPAVLARANGPPFTAGTPISPETLATFIPPNSGETWYVVIVGREPGMYRTPTEANLQTDGVPGQFSQKKTSRREALDFYRERFGQPPPHGVCKWVQLAELPAPLPSGSGSS
ncbi:hypothetical protein C8J57DRAFT_1612119 [Mycena rebaudengoi]|nr:hypothetical protein C8J57DRAFT_1483271 [Mycena rebaudengoi]KAJ7268267.1 hypothetical protein C8J57DRAFT_1612119 [Mycena rebaudengoi]